MPKKYGVKEKDLVVAHVVNLILTGRLRSGDRIDRNEIAHVLGLSRVPIQEAVVQLEHDGILSTRYHRGAFVERFDEAVVMEYHEIYGMLSGIASARAAADPECRVIARLDSLMPVLRNSCASLAFNEASWEYRRTIYDEYAGPRLLANIRASQAFVPRDFWGAYVGAGAEMLALYEHETEAIRHHDIEAAKAVNVERANLLARVMLDELRRRGVLGIAAALAV
ncbi:GntR family transcriptional regulator [Mycobacterium sp. MS1601]|uniref:GntR family transcriptional regulator n=1 Tax=Mycobacterium sp. MS1601 TaxID=1936029 RepID=UPI00097967B8|nr:GntR family transcriptional regulator [Mycobacterium sp. MS1601]AQA06331.1 GntR family transcriptional regulator [Mycobacterium sp. MS1601]